VEFRWIAWNVEHIAGHNVRADEAEYVVEHPARGYPARPGDDKHLVRGQTAQGRHLQVIYLIDDDGAFSVIHARDLTANETSRLKRKR
jgi:uncharacterized DUF497 family protein